jgi:hypothetical protein
LRAPLRKRLRAALERQGVASDRLLLVTSVSSLWRALEDFAVDLYIGSFPLRGARASVEVMGSGTPAVWHVAGEASRFHDTHMKSPEAAEWRKIGDLLDILRSIDADWLRRQSQAARRHYEARHHPRILADCLSAPGLRSATIVAAPGGSGGPRPVGFDELPARRFQAVLSLAERLARSVRGRLSADARARARPT